mmetsp:Transcript_113046/g.298608  ORF Transcript_113046/g.298608 Transcript_113046/m.298608 type:complete len:209 (+) Transcript_113046:841-1467(+)
MGLHACTALSMVMAACASFSAAMSALITQSPISHFRFSSALLLLFANSGSTTNFDPMMLSSRADRDTGSREGRLCLASAAGATASTFAAISEPLAAQRSSSNSSGPEPDSCARTLGAPRPASTRAAAAPAPTTKSAATVVETRPAQRCPCTPLAGAVVEAAPGSGSRGPSDSAESRHSFGIGSADSGVHTRALAEILCTSAHYDSPLR